MKKGFLLSCVLNISLISLSPLNPAWSSQQVEQHSIKLTQIAPYGDEPHTIISARSGSTIIANHDSDGYQLSYDKGLTWHLTITGDKFIPQEFSPLNNSDVLAIEVQDTAQGSVGTLIRSADAGTTWNPVTNSTCPVWVTQKAGVQNIQSSAKIWFIPNQKDELLFLSPTEGKPIGNGVIFYSADGGQTCVTKSKGGLKNLNVSVAGTAQSKAGINMFLVEENTQIFWSQDGFNWSIVFAIGGTQKVALQAQDHNNSAVDYVALEKSNQGEVTFWFTKEAGLKWSSAKTNLIGVNYLATTGNDSLLFALNGKNQFMLQDSPENYEQFLPLKEVFSDEADRKDLSNWTLHSLAWTNPEHTEGIVNFVEKTPSYKEVTYQFEIQ